MIQQKINTFRNTSFRPPSMKMNKLYYKLGTKNYYFTINFFKVFKKYLLIKYLINTNYIKIIYLNIVKLFDRYQTKIQN